MSTRKIIPSEASITTAPKCPKDAPPHYAAIHAEAMIVGWPAHYATDVTTHDRRVLIGRAVDHDTGKEQVHENPIGPSEPFGWILRESGSCLIPIVGTSSASAGTAAGAVQAFGADACRFYAWDGVALLRFKCAADLDAWVAKRRGDADEHFSSALCDSPHCRLRWILTAKGQGYSGADRHYCERHVPPGGPCGGCKAWLTPDRGPRCTVCVACSKKREKKAARVAAKEASK